MSAAIPDKFTPELVELAIAAGMVDDRLEMVQSALDRRKAYIASEKLANLSVGDRIHIAGSVRPALLGGASCDVIGFEGTDKVKVKLLYSYSSKWRAGMTVTLPKSLIG